MKKINRKDIKEAVEYVFRAQKEKQPQERKIKFMSYCKGVGGAKSYSSTEMNLCSHPECNNCRNLEQLFKEEVKLQLEKIENGEICSDCGYEINPAGICINMHCSTNENP